jgi:hypothetical protein
MFMDYWVKNSKWSSGAREARPFFSSRKFKKIEYKHLRKFWKKYYDIDNGALYHFLNFRTKYIIFWAQ